MLVSSKPGADFSRGCALPATRARISATHPHPAIRGWFYVSPACAVVLGAAHLYSLLQYLVPYKKVQGGKCAIIGA
jgi:hypothetical protein